MSKKKKKSKEEPEKRDNTMAIDLAKFIKRADCNGTVEDALLSVEDGIGIIKAFDKSAGIYVHTVCDIPIDDGEYGLGRLEILNNYIKSNQDKKIAITQKSNRLNFKIKGHGKLLFLLTEPGTIMSQPEGDGPSPEDITEPFSYTLPLKQDVVNDLINYISYLKIRSIDFSVNKKGSVIIAGGLDSESKFTLSAGKFEPIDDGDLPEESATVLAEHLIAVLRMLEWEETSPELMFADDAQGLCVKQDDDNMWMLRLLTSAEDE